MTSLTLKYHVNVKGVTLKKIQAKLLLQEIKT